MAAVDETAAAPARPPTIPSAPTPHLSSQRPMRPFSVATTPVTGRAWGSRPTYILVVAG